MNTQDTHPDQGRAVDDTGRDAKRIRDEYAAANAVRAANGDDLPTAAMDDAIRAAARRAVNARPYRLAQSWPVRNRAPLAAAAVLVLSASLVLVMYPQEERQLKSHAVAPNSTVRADESAEASTAKPVQEAKHRIDQPSQGPTAAAAAKSDSMRRAQARESTPMSPSVPGVSVPTNEAVVAATTQAASPPILAYVPAPAAPPAPAQAAPVAKDATVQGTLLAGASVPQSAAFAGTQADTKAKATETAAIHDKAEQMANVERRERAAEQKTPITYATPAPPPARTANAPAVLEPPQPSSAKVAAALPTEPEAAWIKRMLELQKAGDSAKLIDELKRFRAIYPRTKLPKPLADTAMEIDKKQPARTAD